MERVPGHDAHYLYEERAGQPMHTLKLLVFDTPPESQGLTAEEVRETLAARICQLAPLRRRVWQIPLRLFHPVWVDAGEPDLAFHVRSASVAAPGGERELSDLVAALAAEPLDRSRPLWGLWVVEGMPAGSAAMVLKLHHAAADGSSNARVIAHLLGGIDASEPLVGEPAPSRARLLIDALPELARTVIQSPRVLARAMRAGRATRRLRSSSSARLATAFSGPRMAWNEAPTMRRSFGWVSLDRTEMRLVQDARGCTTAELVLAIVAGAARSYLGERGALPGTPGLSTSVPVSLRGPEDVRWGNHVGNLFVELASELEDPLERLSVISEAMSCVREHRGELDLEQWDGMWQLFPLVRVGYLAALAVSRHIHRHPTFSMIVSSVTGPKAPLSYGDANLRAIHSVGVLTEDLGLNVTTWSYGEQVSFGVTSCPEFVGDIWDLVGRIPPALDELVRSCQSEERSRASA